MALMMPLLLPLTAQAMCMSQGRAGAQALVGITPRLIMNSQEMSRGWPGTTRRRGMIVMLPVLLPLTAQAMSMSRDRAWAQAVFITITPPLSMTRPATSSGLPATTDRAMAMILPMLLKLTAQAM